MTTANVLAHTDPKEERERTQRPLDLRLMLRLWTYTRPYALKRNLLFAIVIIRAVQGVVVAAAIGYIIKGPITEAKQTGRIGGVLVAAAAFGLWVLLTYVVMYFRTKLAADLGERVIHDLRMDLFTRMQRMTMSYYDRTKVGRIISRFTSDAEAVRVGIQNVVFVSLVNGATMVFAAALMAYLDWMLFLVVAVLAPILWAINYYFRQRISHASRVVQESFSRVTANLAETVSGIRVTQGFVRQGVNDRRLASASAGCRDAHRHADDIFFPRQPVLRADHLAGHAIQPRVDGDGGRRAGVQRAGPRAGVR